ncbi:hypothetical protein CK224_08310 [Mesorhizobium sp. WSM3862]|nr:hypothetical protein CK224_08310 [Mesorhizobium sp. WSM3862]
MPLPGVAGIVLYRDAAPCHVDHKGASAAVLGQKRIGSFEARARLRGPEGFLTTRPSDAFKGGVDGLRREQHAPRFDETAWPGFAPSV